MKLDPLSVSADVPDRKYLRRPSIHDPRWMHFHDLRATVLGTPVWMKRSDYWGDEPVLACTWEEYHRYYQELVATPVACLTVPEPRHHAPEEFLCVLPAADANTPLPIDRLRTVVSESRLAGFPVALFASTGHGKGVWVKGCATSQSVVTVDAPFSGQQAFSLSKLSETFPLWLPGTELPVPYIALADEAAGGVRGHPFEEGTAYRILNWGEPLQDGDVFYAGACCADEWAPSISAVRETGANRVGFPGWKVTYARKVATVPAVAAEQALPYGATPVSVRAHISAGSGFDFGGTTAAVPPVGDWKMMEQQIKNLRTRCEGLERELAVAQIQTNPDPAPLRCRIFDLEADRESLEQEVEKLKAENAELKERNDNQKQWFRRLARAVQPNRDEAHPVEYLEHLERAILQLRERSDKRRELLHGIAEVLGGAQKIGGLANIRGEVERLVRTPYERLSTLTKLALITGVIHDEEEAFETSELVEKVQKLAGSGV